MATREEAEAVAVLLGFDRISRMYADPYFAYSFTKEFSIGVYRGDDFWNVYGDSEEAVYENFIESAQRQIFRENNPS